MAYRAGGMSDSSDDELFYDENIVVPRKIIQTYNKVEVYKKEAVEPNEEQDCQFRVRSACMTGQLSIIDEYIKFGRNVDDFLYTGWTLLLYGSSAVLPEVIEHLLQLGADPNKHKDGFTPLMAVCQSSKGTSEQCLKCISLLLEAKANPNATNKDRITPLMYACRARDPEVVEELIKHSSNIDACDTDGKTALFHAVSYKNTEVVKLLLKEKASTTILDRRDRSVQEIANDKEYNEILELLEFNGEEIENFCPVTKVVKWQDALKNIDHPDPECIDGEIVNLLYALNLDEYRRNFKGIGLKTFLQLTEKDLINLGVDIQLHRRQFMTGLLKFHSAKWKTRSIKLVDKNMPYTIFDAVMALANVARQIAIIGSSFQYITNKFVTPDGKQLELTDTERESYKKELIEAEKLLIVLKKDFQRMLNFSQKIESSNRGAPPPDYIDKSYLNNKKKINWTVVLTVTLMTGMFLSKTSYIQKLWN